MKYYLKNDLYIKNSDIVIPAGTEYRKITEVQVGLDRYKTYYKQVVGEDVIPNVIRTLPVEIVDFINYFCDVVKNTDVCRDGEIESEWAKYKKLKDGKVSV